MRALLKKKSVQIAIYLFFDLVSIGLGMGVPFFTILLGLPVGWVLPAVLPADPQDTRQFLAAIMKWALLTSSASLLILSVLWLPSLTWYFDPARDLENFGIPMILYTPRASYLGWLILMLLISPFLQFLMTLFGAASRIVFNKKPAQSD